VPNRDIIVIGGSSGATAPLKEILPRLQPGLPAAIFVALRIALRIIEERAGLVRRMAEDGRRSGRMAVAHLYEARASEYREYTDMIRRVMLESLDTNPAG
jgi:hypothetical protein